MKFLLLEFCIVCFLNGFQSIDYDYDVVVNDDDDDLNHDMSGDSQVPTLDGERLCYCVIFDGTKNQSVFRNYNENNDIDFFLLVSDMLITRGENVTFDTDLAIFANTQYCFKQTRGIISNGRTPLFFPIFLMTFWVPTSYLIQNSTKPCTVCVCASNRMWIVYEGESVDSSFTKFDKRNDTREYCLFYESTYSPFGLSVHGFEDDTGGEFRGFINDLHVLKDGMCEGDDSRIIHKTSGKAKITTAAPTSTTTERPIGKSYECRCTKSGMNDGDEGFAIKEDDSFCLYFSSIQENESPTEFQMQELLRSDAHCSSTIRYFLNVTHVVDCKRGYRYSVVEFQYVIDLSRERLTAQVCRSFSQRTVVERTLGGRVVTFEKHNSANNNGARSSSTTKGIDTITIFWTFSVFILMMTNSHRRSVVISSH